MATSAFKSTTRNPNSSPKTNPEQPKYHPNPIHRRSRSVSAVSPTHFSITWDNPLFWADGSDSVEQVQGHSSKFDEFSDVKTGGGCRRGRSVSRRRPRSLSRAPHFESVREQERSSLSSVRSTSKIRLNRNDNLLDDKSKVARSGSDVSEVLKGCNTWSSQHPAFETSNNSLKPHRNVGMSTRAVSEVQERTIVPILEEKKVIHCEDNNIGGGILETVRTEVRRAISNMHKDLKDYEERTRKLRPELAVEEHRELELNQILSDMIPEPETRQVQKPRLTRKASTERKKMSKRLEEEAMAYFDECISISTFDDSDFSSLEDPPSHTVKGGETKDAGPFPNRDTSWSLDSQDLRRQSSGMHCGDESSSSTSGISRSSQNSLSRRPQFSFTSKQSDSTSHEQSIRNYVKIFSKAKEQETLNHDVVRLVPQKSESYDSNVPLEKFLLDKMAFRSRIESGSMLLCGREIGFPWPLFSANLW